MVRRLAAASIKWKGMKTVPGGDFSVTFAVRTMVPRRELTRTRWPSAQPILAASAGLISHRASGYASSSWE